MPKTKILICDDDRHIAELLTLYLRKEGYDTKEVYNGADAVRECGRFAPSLILLDIMMPEMDGTQALSEIRRAGATPVILLTAKGETFDKVLGLSLGADDYIVKPFDPKELIARIKAVLRRSVKPEGEASGVLAFDGLTVSQPTYTVVYRGAKLDLPPKEFELLYYLASHPNRVFTREQLLDSVWGYDFMGDTRTVDVHVKRLREKMPGEDAFGVKTVWGVGYKFEVAE
ncbi:MAG: response regulator transcription factor [Clostridiales bacterium]|jgi:DNA-binding response OmpR family regulator|nr:response regulator transcription factor [Clostridiales bacterium]